MNYKGVVLDFNGTMVWDTPFHKEAWLSYARELGVSLSEEGYYREVHGQTNKNILQVLLHREISDEELRIHGQNKERCYRESCTAAPERFVLAPGVEEFLAFLKDRNIPRTIATASEGVNLAFFIDYFRLDRWFDTDLIVYDDGKIANKPEPEIYLKAAQRLGHRPKDLVVVEDTYYGVLSARAAGAGRIILTGPAQDRHGELSDMDGIYKVISHFDEIDRNQWGGVHAVSYV